MPIASLRGRDILDDASISASEFTQLIDLAETLSAQATSGGARPLLNGRVVAALFEKTSSRTRLAIEVAAAHQGARAVFLDAATSQWGHKESLEDTVRLLSGTCDAIAFRGSAQSDLQLIADAAEIPVFNMLTDLWHPTQLWADVLTMRQATSKELGDISYAFIGDGRCNVANSQLVTGALLGMDVRIIAPASLQPAAHVQQRATELADISGARITVTDDVAALESVDVVSTDVWVSMGEPEHVWAERAALLLGYRVDAALMARTGRADTAFMHCLPAFHDTATTVGAQIAAATGLHDGIEVSDEVFRGARSLVWQQAANRVWTTEALFLSALS
ncbi:MAG: ornithine carbamoyltransferase [Actinobacteria bacterium]|nr:ornithine carbamoyltransferase [Actinomycetota bacterium]